MPEQSTVGAKYVGDCWKCGWPCHENLRHECPTTPRYTGTHTYGGTWVIMTRTGQ